MSKPRLSLFALPLGNVVMVAMITLGVLQYAWLRLDGRRRVRELEREQHTVDAEWVAAVEEIKREHEAKRRWWW